MSTAAPAAFGPSSRAFKQAAEHRAQAHDVEERAVDDAGLDHSRLAAEADHREIDGGELAERAMVRDARSEVVDLRNRERRVLARRDRARSADVDEAIFVAVDERPKQHAAHDAEDRGVGADAERERHDDGQRPCL